MSPVTAAYSLVSANSSGRQSPGIRDAAKQHQPKSQPSCLVTELEDGTAVRRLSLRVEGYRAGDDRDQRLVMLAQELLDVVFLMLEGVTRWCCAMQRRRQDSYGPATPLFRSYLPPAGSRTPRTCRSRTVIKLTFTGRSGGHIELP